MIGNIPESAKCDTCGREFSPAGELVHWGMVARKLSMAPNGGIEIIYHCHNCVFQDENAKSQRLKTD